MDSLVKLVTEGVSDGQTHPSALDDPVDLLWGHLAVPVERCEAAESRKFVKLASSFHTPRARR
jgi:hypothetical protein